MPGRQNDYMRREAMRRSREMHRSGHFSMDPAGDEPPAELAPPDPPPPAPAGNPIISAVNELIGGGVDRDTLLIGALLLLLIREGGDLRLILALAYILL